MRKWKLADLQVEGVAGACFAELDPNAISFVEARESTVWFSDQQSLYPVVGLYSLRHVVLTPSCVF